MNLAKVVQMQRTRILMQSQRSFGAPAGNHKYVRVPTDKVNSTLKTPSDADVKSHIPEKYIQNDNFLAWVNGKFPFDRFSDKLMNDKVNKYSAYHYFGTQALLQNGLVLKLVRTLFGDSQKTKAVDDAHAEFNGVQTHENAVFLYQSK